jgi:hypothetical protein
MAKADPVAVEAAKKKCHAGDAPPTTTVKLSRFVREYITAKAEWNESIDSTLRRLLGLPAEDRR